MVVLSPLLVMICHDWTRLTPLAADKTLRIWEADSGRLYTTLKGHTAGINDLSWSHDSQYICTASDDFTIRIWDRDLVHIFPLKGILTRQSDQVKVLEGHTNFVFCVSFNPKSNLIVSGSFDETVRIWDARKVIIRIEFVADYVGKVYEGSYRTFRSRFCRGFQSRWQSDCL